MLVDPSRQSFHPLPILERENVDPSSDTANANEETIAISCIFAVTSPAPVWMIPIHAQVGQGIVPLQGIDTKITAAVVPRPGSIPDIAATTMSEEVIESEEILRTGAGTEGIRMKETEIEVVAGRGIGIDMAIMNARSSHLGKEEALMTTSNGSNSAESPCASATRLRVFYLMSH